ncbi:MAG: DUF4424 family protein [Magnetococcales bacterium]|nr:DUF4424 family protein [Magnetococcales bacterium]
MTTANFHRWLSKKDDLPAIQNCFTIVIFVVFLWAVSLSETSQANDGIGAVGVGGVVVAGKTDKVQIRKEVLEVGLSKIKVSYEFVNITDQSVTLPVMFPLPRYGGFNGYFGEPEAFKVLIDGQRMTYQTNVRAMQCQYREGQESCQDVTDTLKKNGLSDRQIAYFPPDMLPSLSDRQVQDLLRLGLIDRRTYGNNNLSPEWEVEVTYLWQVTFPVNKVVLVEHEYMPFRSEGTAAMQDESEMRNKFCADNALISFWKKKDLVNKFNGTPNIEYILTTANTWAGPIDEFTLILRKSKPSELISLCFPGKVVKVDPVTLEIRLTNFTPEHELNVLFMNGIEYEIPGIGQAPSFNHRSNSQEVP